MSMHGDKKIDVPIIVGDSDGLIALFHPSDAHAEEAMRLLEILQKEDVRIVFPATTVAETITTFQRKLNNPTVVEKLVSEVKKGSIVIEAVDMKLFHEALGLFHPKGSKQNTIFDAIVAVVARKLVASAVFSFDGWYEKVGLVLAKDWVHEGAVKGIRMDI